MTAIDQPAGEVGTLLDRAAFGDFEAYGDFIDLTYPKARRLVLAMGCDDAEATLRRCYTEAWHRLEEYTSGELTAKAWLLTHVYATVGRLDQVTALVERRVGNSVPPREGTE